MSCLHLTPALQIVLSLLVLALGHLLDLLLRCSEFSRHGVASELLVLLIQLLSVHHLARTFLLLPLLATLLAHVCSMRPVFRLHAVFSTALVFSVTSTLTQSQLLCCVTTTSFNAAAARSCCASGEFFAV